MVKSPNNEFSKENKQAFYKEAMVAFVIDFALLGLGWILYFSFIFGYGQDILIILFTIFYLAVAVMLHYRIAILEFLDVSRDDIVKQIVNIIDFKTENSWSGWLGHSNISMFYSKDRMVDRFKIYFLNMTNEKNFIRLIMSLEKRKIIYHTFLEDTNSKSIEICYLKRSKILLSFDLLSDQKYDKNIEKAINQLNKII